MVKSERPPTRREKLYILHGWTYTLKPWQPTVDLLRAAGVEPVFLKVPGLTSPSRKVWTVEDYLVWLDKRLASAVRPAVLGHSNGGRLLLNYCASRPDKIGRLILLNSAGVPPGRFLRLRNAAFRYLSKIFGFAKNITPLRKLVYRLLGAGDYNQAPANMKPTLGNMLDSDYELEAKLPAIGTPVNFVWGENDKVTRPAAGRFLESRLPNVESFEVLAGAGHAPYLTHPAELTRAILKVLMNQ
ncbi:alpha/beta hydrolase [Candidatus Saccharibacteria bacterium]|nr:alpha/beta hydrolase [Candidatus Saccharibacteria bacterium]